MNGSLVTGKFRRTNPLRGALWAALLLAGIGSPAAAEADAHTLRITVSILPQAWFVEQIGGELVEVSILVGPGHSPATYEPTPRQMALLEQADLFLAAGVPFERGLVPRVQALPSAPTIAGPEPGQHSHHHDTDPHTWLDPAQAVAMADTIGFRLRSLDPANSAAYQKGVGALKERLAGIDAQVDEIMSPYRGRTFLVFHPAFGHFAAAYGLVQVSVEAGGHEPGPRHQAEVIELAQELGVRTVIVQPQFSRKSAETVARAVGAEIVVLDPLAADYDNNLLHMARTMADRFAAEDSAGGGKDGP